MKIVFVVSRALASQSKKENFFVKLFCSRVEAANLFVYRLVGEIEGKKSALIRRKVFHLSAAVSDSYVRQIFRWKHFAERGK